MWRVALLALLALPLACVAAAAGARPPLSTAGAVQGVAADGGLVAVNVGPTKADCDHVLVWEPARRSVLRLRPGRGPCSGPSTGQAITSVAIAGRRVAWVHDGGGNQHDRQLFTTTVGNLHQRVQLAVATYEIDSGLGDHIGDVHGDGSLLAFSTWSVCAGSEVEAAFRPCPAGVEPGIYAATIWQIQGTRTIPLVTASSELTLLDVEGDRMAARRADGSLEIRDAEGTLIRKLPFRPEFVQAAELTGRRLLVQHENRLAIYDTETGLIQEDRQLPDGTRLEDADGGFAVATGRASVWIVRLRDGRTVRITVGEGPVHADLEPAGLYTSYAAAGPLRGRVSFLARKALLARF